jgi:MoaA/NifB/PqqE/SkfB family radical SAM enzyme
MNMNKIQAELHIEIIKKCILTCLHCSSNQNPHYTVWSNKNFDKIVNYIERQVNNYDFIVTLTGGEPLLLDNITSIFGRLKRVSNVNLVGIFTAGCIYDENEKIISVNLDKATSFKQVGLDFCYVSLFSHLQTIHDRITQTTDSHKMTVDTIKNLIKSGIVTRINCPITKLNTVNLINFITYCETLNVDEVRFLRLVNHGRAIKNWGEIGLERQLQKDIIEQAINEAEKAKVNIKISVAGFPEKWNCRPFNIGSGCQAGKGLFYIDESGDIYPCASKKLNKRYLLLSLKKEKYNHHIEIKTPKYICSQDE